MIEKKWPRSNFQGRFFIHYTYQIILWDQKKEESIENKIDCTRSKATVYRGVY